MPERGPDRASAIEKYRRVAAGYDRRIRFGARLQRAAVERLQLRPGETVIDVACGTGLNFARLKAAIGPRGRIVGIDLSPEMLALARDRSGSHGWDNVTLIEAPVEEAELEVLADAALFSFTHDVLQSPRAVANVVAHLRGGGRFACVGPKLAGHWNLPVNFAVRRLARPYVTTFEGLDRPWRELERHAEAVQFRSLALGGAYVAWGSIKRAGVSRAAPAERAASPGSA